MSLILPPRLEDRAAADEAMMVTIPVYVEEPGESLRPTWLPADPSTYAPPRRRARRVSFGDVGKVALGLVATFALSFSFVVGPHFAREYVAKRALAKALAVASSISSDPISSVDHGLASSSTGSSAPTKAVASGVILTVDVNDLPVSKDFTHNRKGRAGGSRRAGS